MKKVRVASYHLTLQGKTNLTLKVVRLEWVHAHAAHERWKEEFYLLQEESRRVAMSFSRQSEEWQEKRALYDGVPLCEQTAWGFKAYVERQAEVYASLAAEALISHEAAVVNINRLSS